MHDTPALFNHFAPRHHHRGQLIHSATQRLEQAQVGFGDGTQNAQQEATWLILWSLGQPLDSALGTEENSIENHPVTPDQQAQAATLIEERIRTRKPAAYLTNEAWLMGVPFYVDERAIRAAQLYRRAAGRWQHRRLALGHHAQRPGFVYRQWLVGLPGRHGLPRYPRHRCRHQPHALAVARINVEKHQLQERITLVHSDGLAQTPAPGT